MLTLMLGGLSYGHHSRQHSAHDVLNAHRHNELDLPSITSPLMYEKIAARKSVPQLYEQKLIVRTFLRH